MCEVDVGLKALGDVVLVSEFLAVIQRERVNRFLDRLKQAGGGVSGLLSSLHGDLADEGEARLALHQRDECPAPATVDNGVALPVAYAFPLVHHRCQVHLDSNVLGRTPRHLRGTMAEGLKRIFRAETATDARSAFGDLVEMLAGKTPRAMEVLENGLDDSLTVLELPEKYRRRLRTTNMAERLNDEVRRRENVIRIFPNEASAQRLIGALLAEQHEVWFTGKCYFFMTEYFEWKEKQEKKQQTGKLVKIG